MGPPPLDLLPAGCLVTSLTRELRYANAFFQSDLGLAPADLLGQSLDRLLTPASCIFYESYMHPTLLTEGACSEVSLTVRSGTGARIPVVVNLRVWQAEEPLVIWTLMRAENRDKIHEALRQARESLQANAKRLEEMAYTDALTGLSNRRAFEVQAESAIAEAGRTGQPLVLALIDIDHFKTFNDDYGHAVGDDILRTLGQRLAELKGEAVTIARYGGEEFMCCLPGADLHAGQDFASAVHRAVAEIEVQGRGVTVSIGLAPRPGGSRLALEALIKLADLALYKAKAAGRNRTVTCLDRGCDPAR